MRPPSKTRMRSACFTVASPVSDDQRRALLRKAAPRRPARGARICSASSALSGLVEQQDRRVAQGWRARWRCAVSARRDSIQAPLAHEGVVAHAGGPRGTRARPRRGAAALDLGIGGVGAAECGCSRRAEAPKITGSCGTSAMGRAERSRGRISVSGTPSSVIRPEPGVVKPQEKLKDGGLCPPPMARPAPRSRPDVS